MSTAPDRRLYSGFSYLHKVMGALAFVCTFLLYFAFLGFHIDAFIISFLVAAGTILWIPPLKKQGIVTEYLHDQPGDEDFPIPNNFESWRLFDALFFLRTRALTVNLRSRDSDLVRDLIDDALWIHKRWELLADYPEHKATIELIVKNYLPTVICDHYEVASRQLSRRERKLLDDLTRTDLAYLITDVRRVREAISSGSLNTLESHAEAIRRSLETRSKLPPDVL